MARIICVCVYHLLVNYKLSKLRVHVEKSSADEIKETCFCLFSNWHIIECKQTIYMGLEEYEQVRAIRSN